jgi:glutamine amidotransferase
MISIVDYGMGNLGSVLNMFKKIGHPAKLVRSPAEIAEAKKIVLPGVGAFDKAMLRINEMGLKEILDQKALVEKVPTLGICLGMQLLTERSDEGQLKGLGWIAAETLRFPAVDGLKIPHMGWNTVTVSNQNSLTEHLLSDSRFYFVHSFYVKVKNDGNSFLKTHYGVTFDSAIHHENIMGVQFHPEKSHKFGMKLLSNFAAI